MYVSSKKSFQTQTDLFSNILLLPHPTDFKPHGSGIALLSRDQCVHSRNHGECLILRQPALQWPCSPFFSSSAPHRSNELDGSWEVCVGMGSSHTAPAALTLQWFLQAEESQKQGRACWGTHLQFTLKTEPKCFFSSVSSLLNVLEMFLVKVDFGLCSEQPTLADNLVRMCRLLDAPGWSLL